ARVGLARPAHHLGQRLLGPARELDHVLEQERAANRAAQRTAGATPAGKLTVDEIAGHGGSFEGDELAVAARARVVDRARQPVPASPSIRSGTSDCEASSAASRTSRIAALSPTRVCRIATCAMNEITRAPARTRV